MAATDLFSWKPRWQLLSAGALHGHCASRQQLRSCYRVSPSEPRSAGPQHGYRWNCGHSLFGWLVLEKQRVCRKPLDEARLVPCRFLFPAFHPFTLCELGGATGPPVEGLTFSSFILLNREFLSRRRPWAQSERRSGPVRSASGPCPPNGSRPCGRICRKGAVSDQGHG